MATTFRLRLIGLLACRHLPDEEALVFPNCRSIHTLGMRFPIDVLFVDRAWRIVALRPRLRPWRWLLPVGGAWATIEMASGTIARADLHLGDQLLFQHVSDT